MHALLQWVLGGYFIKIIQTLHHNLFSTLYTGFGFRPNFHVVSEDIKLIQAGRFLHRGIKD